MNLCVLLLPDDVKNLQIDLQQDEGCLLIKAEWGGGKDMYGRTFYFKPVKDDLELFKYDGKHITNLFEESEKSFYKTTIVQPSTSISQFTFLDYLSNEP